MSKKRKISGVIESQENAYEKICQEEEKLSKLIFGDSDNLLNIPSSNTSCTSTAEESTAVWEDEDDQELTVKLALKSQKRILPNGGINKRSNKYANLLKEKYTSLIGTPKWANIASETAAENSDEEILQSCGYISNAVNSSLSKDILEYKKLRDLNSETYTEGPYVNIIEFHPGATVGLVAGSSGIFSLFAVDGKRNSKLQSVRLEKFRIRCAKFNKNANEIVLGSSKHSYMYAYDLEKAEAQRIFLPEDITNMQKFVLSPNGKYIAVAGRFGQVFILDSNSKEKIFTLKQDSKVRALSFTPNNEQLYAHSDTGKVSIWDLTMRRMSSSWYDEGCIQGSCLDISPCGKFVSTGSFEGVVNIYNRDQLISENPKPKKAVMNLTTCITALKFNPTSEILAFASMERDGALKFLHVGSQTVFSNFPGLNKDLCKINSLGFSPASGYFAVGNNKSKVLLYRLKHYSNY